VDRDSVLAAALPGYEIGSELGRGAFGVVVGGRHRQLGREVAIKQLSPSLMSDAAVRARFLSEAQVLASIDHPHVVPVYDYVEQEDSCILVMERLAGGTVWHRFVNRGFDQRSACAIALGVCSGLHAAHQHGVLHRDMKPENVLFGADHSLKVTDFGIARVLGQNDVLARRDGELLGTPAYMAPEQASGTDLGPATDVYAVGVMLYELLTGHLPFREDGGSMAIVLRHINEDPTPLLQVAPMVPGGLAEVVMNALARSPGDRFETAEMFGIAIGRETSTAWGSNWLEETDVVLRDSGPILVSARSATEPPSQPDHDRVVRPTIEVHTKAGAAAELSLDDLMPLRRRSVELPPFPARLTWLAVGLSLVAIVLGLLGFFTNPPHSNLAPGQLTLNGHDPAKVGSVPLDLNRDIVIGVRSLPDGGKPALAQLTLAFGGVAVVHSTDVPLVHRSNGWSALVDASIGRYIVGGKLSASVRIVGPGGAVTDNFAARVDRSPFGTFGGIVGIILLLVVAAYGESLLRTLRGGYRRNIRASVAGLTVVGAFMGITAGFWGWMLGFSSPTLLGLLGPAIIGAGSGLVAASAARQMGRRARINRQSNRLVLVARKSSLHPHEAPALDGG